MDGETGVHGVTRCVVAGYGPGVDGMANVRYYAYAIQPTHNCMQSAAGGTTETRREWTMPKRWEVTAYDDEGRLIGQVRVETLNEARRVQDKMYAQGASDVSARELQR